MKHHIPRHATSHTTTTSERKIFVTVTSSTIPESESIQVTEELSRTVCFL